MPNEKWKNLATGEEWEKDTSGIWVVSKKAQEQLEEFIQRPSSIDISPEAEVLPEKPLSYEAIQYLPTITSIIGSLAGLLSGTIGSAATTGAGAAYGNVLKNLTLRAFPKTFKLTPREIPTEEQTYIEPFIEGATAGVGDIAGSYLLRRLAGRYPIAESLAKRFASRTPPSPEKLDYYKTEAPDVPLTLGQVTGSPTLSYVEDLFFPGTSLEHVKGVHKNFIDYLENLVGSVRGANPENIVESIRPLLSRASERFRNIENRLYSQFRNIAKQNKVQTTYKKGGKTITETIEGPVYFNETVNLLNDLAARNNIQGLGGLKNILIKANPQLASTMNSLFTVVKRDKKGKQFIAPVPIDFSINLKSAIGKRAFRNKLKEVIPTFTDTDLMNITKAIDTDVENSIANTGALSIYQQAKEVATLRRSLFNPEEQRVIRNLIKTDVGAREQITKIYNDPAVLDRVLKASGPEQPLTKQILGAEYLDRVAKTKETKAGVEVIDLNALKKAFEKKNLPITSKLFTASQRAGLENFTTVANEMRTDVNRSTRFAIAWRAALGTLLFGERTIKGLMGEEVTGKPSGFEMVALTLGLGTVAMKRMLTDPKLVRIATGLLKTPQDSTRAKVMTKVLFQGLRGATLNAFNDEGVKMGEFEINEDGRIVPKIPE